MEQSRENTGKVGKNNPPVHAQFKPGQSGNPAGKPLGTKHRGTILRQLLDTPTIMEDAEGKEMKCTVEERMLMALIKKSFDGDVQAVREALDSVYGKAPQTVHNTGNVGINVYYREQPGNDPLPEEND